MCLLRVMCDEGGLFSMSPPGSLLICFVFRLSVSGSLWAWRWFLVQCDVKRPLPAVERTREDWCGKFVGQLTHELNTRTGYILPRVAESKVVFAPVDVRRLVTLPRSDPRSAPLRSAPLCPVAVAPLRPIVLCRCRRLRRLKIASN